MMDSPVCAGCQGAGKLACKSCLMVVYCGAECQKAHWPTHKLDCKSPWMRNDWQPSWQAEGRAPHFVGNDAAPVKIFGVKKYLWGNVPALDVLQLAANEGAEYAGDLGLLFAASGDPRNVVQTVASLPDDCSAPVSATINDVDFHVVARNAIMLLVALCASDAKAAADCVLHVWYSAALTTAHIDLLNSAVRPLIADVCAKIADKTPAAVLGKTWSLESGSVRLVLPKERWLQLLAFFQLPGGVTAERARQLRQAVTLAPERRDYLDRALYAKPPAHRLGAIRFREHGVLLPFGQSRDAYSVPNPTLFQSGDWPMMDSSEPLDGWDHRAVLRVPNGPASNDIYGKLHARVHGLLHTFCLRARALGVRFILVNVDARALGAAGVDEGKFARVELSNICDQWCLGPAGAVGTLGRFLQPPATNPHATLLTLFLNAVHEELSERETQHDMQRDMPKALTFLPMTGLPRPGDPQLLVCVEAVSLFRDNDKYFDRYMRTHSFREIERAFGVAVKSRHSIVDKWPARLKKAFGAAGSQAEFKAVLASGATGTERYVEWKKVS